MHIQLNLKNAFILAFFLSFFYLGYLIMSSEDHYDLDVELKDIMSYAVLAVEMGGHAVVKIYNETKSQLNIQAKGKTDGGKAELLTKADLVSNHLMLSLLRQKTEELTDKEVESYKDDNYKLWLAMKPALDKLPSKSINLDKVSVWIDPLDATQEFTGKNFFHFYFFVEGLTDYVTVMACIAVEGKPVFGVIYRPFFDQTIMGLVNYGLVDGTGARIQIDNNPLNSRKLIVVSRSHAGKVEEVTNKTFGHEYTVEPAGGSGFKTLKLLNRNAELYLHTTAIKKWDLCAGDALIRSAGGHLIDFDGHELDYSAGARSIHKNGLLMALKNPYSILAKLKPNLPKTQ